MVSKESISFRRSAHESSRAFAKTRGKAKGKGSCGDIFGNGRANNELVKFNLRYGWEREHRKKVKLVSWLKSRGIWASF